MNHIITYVSNIMTTFNTYAKDNQFIAGMLGLYGLGIMSYFFKDVPRQIWSTIKKFSTTTVTLTSSNDSFHMFLRWYEKKGYAKKGRYIKITNGRFGDESMIKSVGYGTHYFIYKYRLIILHLIAKETAGVDRDKDHLTMTLVGRSHKVFDNIFNDVEFSQQDTSKFVIKKFKESWWARSSEQRPRRMNTIFLRKGIKERLLNHLNKFVSMEKWYLESGIPYQTGILLYGPPGTGKTSIIKAVACYLGYQIHILKASSLHNIEEAMFNLPEKSLICIEDIDTNSATKQRHRIKRDVPKSKELTETVDEEDDGRLVLDLNFANLSDILNAIDGVQTNHGRILFLTSNNIENLDRALIRPGRIDLMLEIDYADNYVLKQFFNKFYSGYEFDYKKFIMKDYVTSAKIQNLILENIKDPHNVLKQLKEV